MSRRVSSRRHSLWRMSQEDTEVASHSIAAGRHDFEDLHSSAAASAIAASTEIDSGDVDSPKTTEEEAVVGAVDVADDTKDEAFGSIMLPESTHTLLFTEPINSNAFEFSVSIAGLSILCLLLALTNNGIANGLAQIPANVGIAVKIAQYASIFIALLMEEEIPTGLYLLRRIPKQYFESKFPELKYCKFVCSCMLRIFTGYLFLVNVLLILMQASNVIEIFFDFIALQFLQQLDDIAFNLARMGVFSKSLMEATTNKYFRTEFKKKTEFGQSRRISLFLKTIYFLNLVGLLCGQVVVTVKQARGNYQCKSITVIYKGEVWEDSIVRIPGKETQKMVLIYPYFNGVYEQDGTSNDGRPVYIEQNKFDSTPFDTTTQYPESIVKIPAKIQYCKSIRAWVFMHEHIRKSPVRDDSDCPWLLRSEETDVFDIEEVQGPWQVWAGVISRTDVDIVCNECNENADCNLNGVCNKKNGKCECYNDIENVTFLGSHCEVRLKDECRTIYGETYNDTWSVIPVDWGVGLYQEYDRPVYFYQGGHPEIGDNDFVVLIYSGDRWFGVYEPEGQPLLGSPIFEFAVTNYHAFWDEALKNVTIFVSDPTTNDNPVGVDFYKIGERGNQFGPYGALYPMQLNNQTGRGVFRCTDSNPYVYVDPFANVTGPGRKLHKEGLFDSYLWLGEPN